MQLACTHAKVGRICKNMDSFLSCQQECILREPDIVADTQAKSGEFSLKSRQLSWSSTHIIAFKESDPAWDVNVEQMLLAVGGSDLTFFIEAQ